MSRSENMKKGNVLKILLKFFIIFFISICSLSLIGIGFYNIIINVEIFNSNILTNISIIYIGMASITFVPIIYSIFKEKIELTSYNVKEVEKTKLKDENKIMLENFNEQMTGTLKFWKKSVVIYKNLYYYSAIWTTIISVALPILIQLFGSSEKNLLTIISGHSAIILAICKGFKVENKYQLYRRCESNFYDRYRKLLSYDQIGIKNEDDLIMNYIKDVNEIRKLGRNIETDNAPDICNKGAS